MKTIEKVSIALVIFITILLTIACVVDAAKQRGTFIGQFGHHLQE